MQDFPVAQATKAFTKSLCEFGYNVDETTVRTKIDQILAGEKPTDIIGMFVEGFIKDIREKD